MGKRTTKPVKTKKQSQKIGISQRGDMPILAIPTQSDDSQILVTLRKVPHGGGASEWLSPVGWGDNKKSTLLDCYATDSGCEIIIPDTYAKGLDEGDKLYVSCAALNVRGDCLWKAAPIAPTAPAVATVAKAAPAGLMSRILSRGQADTVNVPEIVEESSDAQRRAADAQKLADEYRIQMERAAAAREDAQRQALEAARKAEDALQAEADRIAEMERAAKAFAEAEAQRQDEERRLEAERRAEELRLAEEVRLAEEARQRELAIARAAERAEEKKRLLAVQEEASNRRAQLTQTIEAERSALHRLEVDRKTKAESLAVLADGVADNETELSILAQDLNGRKSGLTSLDERLVIATAREADAANVQSQMAQDVASAARAFEEAKAEADAAKLRANQRKAEHDAMLSERKDAEDRAEKAAKDLNALKADRVKADAAVLSAQTSYNAAQDHADAHRVKMDTLIHEDATMEAVQQSHKSEIDRLAHELDAALSQQDAAHAALSTLDEGGDVRAARQIMASVGTDSVHPAITAMTDAKAAEAKIAEPKSARFDTARFGKVFRKNKAAALSIPAKTLVDSDSKPAAMLAPQTSVKTTIKETPGPITSTPKTSNDGATSIIAAQMAANHNGGNARKFAVLGAGALALSVALGFGWSAMTRPDTKKIVTAKPAPSEVLTVETRNIESAKAAPGTSLARDISPAKALAQDTTPATVKTPIKVAEAVTPQPVTMKIETPNVAPKLEASKPKAPQYASVNVNRLARSAARTDRRARARQARLDAAAARKVSANAVPAKPSSQQVPAKSIQRQQAPAIAAPTTSAPAQAAPITRTASAPIVATPNRRSMSPAVTRTVQQNLQRLGYYTGSINGVMSPALTEAAQLFNTIYDMPQSGSFNRAFVDRLSSVVSDLNAIQTATQPVVKSASVTPLSVAAVPQNGPTIVAPAQTLPAQTAPVQSAPVKTASAPLPTPTAITKEAQLLDGMKIIYPKKAERRNIFENVTVEVTYDIAVDGSVTNAKVYDIDYSGRLANAFEVEALRGISRMRYAPKTVDGKPVAVTGQRKRVSFRVE